MTETVAGADGAHSLEEANSSCPGERAARRARLRRPMYRPLSLLVLIIVWIMVSWLVRGHILPGPLATFQTLAGDLQQGEILHHLWVTLLRVVASFALAMCVGVGVGLAMGLSRRVEAFFDTWVVIAITVPGLVYIVVAYIGIGLNEVATVVAAASIVTPGILINVREGAKSIDARLVDMAKVFHCSPGRILRSVVLPQVFPYILAAARSGLGHTWKMVLFAEFMGRSNGIGFQLHAYFQMYDMRHVLSYTVLFVGVMLGIEFFIMKGLEQRVFHWRPRAALQ